MRLEQKMTRSAVKVDPDEAIISVARLMRDQSISSVLVCKPSGELVGILTERDLAHKIVAEGRDSLTLQVRDLMTQNPITADCHERVWEGARIMAENQIRHLPLTRDGSLIGMIDASDLTGSQNGPRETRDVIRGLEATSRERTVEIPASVAASELGEIIPAWY